MVQDQKKKKPSSLAAMITTAPLSRPAFAMTSVSLKAGLLRSPLTRLTLVSDNSQSYVQTQEFPQAGILQ